MGEIQGKIILLNQSIVAEIHQDGYFFGISGPVFCVKIEMD
ncbi:hypothetical protein BN3456_01097 [Clostridium sp. C105KSO13]|nr:hypothetical protein BN3456_01097 [Clostridium sp. C105KSO13]